MLKKFPEKVQSPYSKGGHVQGIAIDEKNGFIYFSFTTVLLKTDFFGNTVGSVNNIVGHLGCITFDRDRNLLYGSLELKHDSIGNGIMNITQKSLSEEDSFYLVCFDCDKITKPDMDAEKDNIMTAVYLPDVVNDYSGTDEISNKPHRYGCSGIDGTAYGKEFGTDSKKIMVAYGIYGDTDRADNDYQVILQFDTDVFGLYGKALNQSQPHHSGTFCEKKYFFFTGNTVYGIQNLEYDSFTNTYIAAVYSGEKKRFENYPMFFIDAKTLPEQLQLTGRQNEIGNVLSPAKPHKSVKESGGCDFSLGQTGIYSFGDGRYAFSQGSISPDRNGEYSSSVVLLKYSGDSEEIFI